MAVSVVGNMRVEIDGNQYRAEFGKIDEVHLGWEDHGIYTIHVGWMEGASSHIGTGHMMLTHRDKDTDEQVVNPRVAQLMIRLMECFGNWENIKGKECLALYKVDENKYSARPVGLAPLPGRGGRPVIFSEVIDGV